jgi:ABC-type transport system involved in cytochrome bd biosynthesis fused ATPase/permease subunit
LVAIAALVLGIIGIVCSWFPAVVIGVPLALIGLILSIVARKNAAATQQPTGIATAGLVVSIVGISFSVISTVACMTCFAKLDKKMKDPAWQQQMREQNEEFRKTQEQNNKEFNDAFKNAVDHTQKPGPGATTVPSPTPTPGAMPAPLGGGAPPALPAPAPPPNLPQK